MSDAFNKEFKNFQKGKREAEEIGRAIEIAGFRELTENERAVLRERLNSFSRKLEDRTEGAVFKLGKSVKSGADEDLSERLAFRLGELVHLREKLREKQELLGKAEE